MDFEETKKIRISKHSVRNAFKKPPPPQIEDLHDAK